VTLPTYSITLDRTPTGALRVILTGDLDMSIGDALATRLVDAAHLPDVTGVVVDLEHTRFIDSHVVAGLVAGYQAAVTARRSFTVVNGHGTVQQVLDVTGLSEVLCS
jgi:anti-anti-sigma factor